MRKINKIIIHCSATPCNQDYDIEDIRFWHRSRGFKDIGYHYVITTDGIIQSGRDIEEIGAHCKGHNHDSIGICYIGGLDTNRKPCDTRTPWQKVALSSLLRVLLLNCDATIHGHNEFANKACPCFDVQKEYSHLLKGGVKNE